MTDDRMALFELVEKQADGGLVREMLAFSSSVSSTIHNFSGDVQRRRHSKLGYLSPVAFEDRAMQT